MTERTVLCFGDSNTHGTAAMRSLEDRERHPKQLRWTSVLANALGDGWDIIAEGHPGRTAVFDDPIEGIHKNGMRVIAAILESHRPIDLVIVMLGTNDLKARFNVSANDIALGLERLAGEIQRSECGPDGAAPGVLLVAPVSVIETGALAEIFAGAADKSAALPQLLHGIARRNGVLFADANDFARIDPVDGIHLNADAHAAIGAGLANVVKDR